MTTHTIVTRQDWITARRALLAKEKALTRQRDRLAAERRALPWVRVVERYEFDDDCGVVTLDDLFAGRRQLVIYHFMFAPEAETGCRSCAFWADHFDGIAPHLAARDTSLVAVSRAPLAKLRAQSRRLGWRFRWVSAGDRSFNLDYGVAFAQPGEAGGNVDYNYTLQHVPAPDMPGVSVFCREEGAVYHTYSCYSRGLDTLNAAYHYLDLTPTGRNEDALPYPMSWVRLRDRYGS
jgi:predicted dithiol-disulfide oxidoreductase (DUF899 family)